MTIETPTDETFAANTVVGVERNIVDYLKTIVPLISTAHLTVNQTTTTKEDFFIGAYYRDNNGTLQTIDAETDLSTLESGTLIWDLGNIYIKREDTIALLTNQVAGIRGSATAIFFTIHSMSYDLDSDIASETDISTYIYEIEN